jgi:4-hydroxy-3-methylbut-2-enyl diphosphate reductase IspH
VIGSRNSSNSNRLVEVARANGVAAHLIDDETETIRAGSRASRSGRHLARRRWKSLSTGSATGSARGHD